METRGKVEMPVIKKGQYPVRYIEHMKGGQGHMITNTGKTSLKYLAVIIYGMSMQFHKMQ